jgi:hypothetical protein
MLTYADVYRRMRTYAAPQVMESEEGHGTYAHVCSRMLTYADPQVMSEEGLRELCVLLHKVLTYAHV